jgi:hypothetical protein
MDAIAGSPAATVVVAASTSPFANVRVRAALHAFAIVLWALAVAGGMHWLWRYKSTPGVASTAPARWPSESRIGAPSGRPLLVMLAHPYCPCTRASLGELAVLMTRFHGAVDARVVFAMPGEDPTHWPEGELWRTAAAIPGVSVTADPSGEEARRFHASTSGAVVAYDAGGRLLFSGGITAARGHHGDNFGRSRLTALLTGAPAERADSPVFGCALASSSQQQERGHHE